MTGSNVAHTHTRTTHAHMFVRPRVCTHADMFVRPRVCRHKHEHTSRTHTHTQTQEQVGRACTVATAAPDAAVFAVNTQRVAVGRRDTSAPRDARADGICMRASANVRT